MSDTGGTGLVSAGALRRDGVLAVDAGVGAMLQAYVEGGLVETE